MDFYGGGITFSMRDEFNLKGTNKGHVDVRLKRPLCGWERKCRKFISDRKSNTARYKGARQTQEGGKLY
jgi:hypothetical protein